jgi:guanylate kinase
MLLCISGPSTIGKSVWHKVAEKIGFPREVPYTTRLARPGETANYDHHYLSIAEFQSMIRTRQLAEWDYTLGNYYGFGNTLTQRQQIGEDFSVQILARMAVRLRMRSARCVSILLTSGESEVLHGRLHERGYTGDELNRRIAHAQDELVHAFKSTIIMHENTECTYDWAIENVQRS